MLKTSKNFLSTVAISIINARIKQGMMPEKPKLASAKIHTYVVVLRKGVFWTHCYSFLYKQSSYACEF